MERLDKFRQVGFGILYMFIDIVGYIYDSYDLFENRYL